jgi:hypothetical protein
MKLIAFLIALLMSQAALAESLFDPCPEVIASKSYQPLNKYLLEKNKQADYCQRLNNHEFIYTTDTNFYYCNFKLNNEPCSEDRACSWYPNLEIKARFSGANGKRFVLFKTSRLSHGIYASGYHVFFFTRKTENPRGYKILPLRNVGEYNGSYSDAGKICSNLNKNDRAIELMDKNSEYVIFNEGKTNVGIRFAQKMTFCETLQTSTQTVEFIWSGNEFVQSIAGIK